MKKKIAVFTGGWSFEYAHEVISGIVEAAEKENADVFAFINYSLRWEDTPQNEMEFNLFTLPDLNDFDGVILLGNSFNVEMEKEYFNKVLKDVKVPVISVEYEFNGIPSIFTDNYAGMRELVEHIVKEHKVREMLFIGGPEEHMESAERLRALLDVAKENGLQMPESNIKYGDWSMGPAMELLNAWIEENNRVPDAVVCANDIMALGVMGHLIGRGYKIPEDVIVTGYDCLVYMNDAYPQLASVSHEWGAMGVKALEMLSDMMQGKKRESVLLRTRFFSNESCGCETRKIDPSRKTSMTKGILDGIVLDSHFRNIYLYIRKNNTIDELSDSLANLMEREHQIEGDDFRLCLEPEFFRHVEGNLNLKSLGYSEELAVVGMLKDGKKQPHKLMKKKDAVFSAASEKEAPGLYMYVPVYSDFKTYGFAIINGDREIIRNNHLYIWTRHINQYLEQVRRNIQIAELTERLTQLSVMDALTGVYNRAGCERIAYPMLADWKEKGGTGVIFLVDVDKMKTINDENGHANGDLALRTVAAVLQAEMPKDWIISRFGGDEFLVGGRVIDDEINIDEICASVERRIAEEKEHLNIDFRLTVSIGGVLIRPEDDIDIEKYLQMADISMYRMKDDHHRIIEEENKE